jgi:hypothetical protein
MNHTFSVLNLQTSKEFCFLLSQKGCFYLYYVLVFSVSVCAIFLFSHNKWESRYVFIARISSGIGNLSHRKHYYNLLYFHSQKPIKILKK